MVIGNGAVGLVGLVLYRHSDPPPWFMPAVFTTFGVALAQVGAGVALLSSESPPGSFHAFYGIVIAFTLAFAYIYRSQLKKRPVLGYSLIALFVMGLGIRGWMSFGVDL